MKSFPNKLLFILFLLSMICVYTIAGCFIISPEPLVVQGEVEASQISISSKIAGRIETLHVKEGNTVKKNQLLVSIESPEIQAKLKQAKASEKAAIAQKIKADKGTRKEKIQTAKNMWLKAQAVEALAGKTYQRVNDLHTDGVLPTQKMDEADAQYIAAKQTTIAAKANYNMAVRGARQEDKTAAEAMMNKAEGAVAEVEAYLKETRLKAPLNSEVASIIPHTGELVSPGFPIISLVDLDDIWVTFNLREDLLSDIKMGSILTAKFPALGNKKIKLKINYIASLGEYATWHATKASGDFDLKTFEIRSVPVQPVKGLRPGMSALVSWDTQTNRN